MSRRFALSAVVLASLLAPATAPASGAPASPARSEAEAGDRLRKAGLDPKDASVGVKLRALAGPASAAYTRSQTVSFTPKAPGAPPATFLLAHRAAVSPGLAQNATPGHGTVREAYTFELFSSPVKLAQNPTISAGGLRASIFLVETDRPIADPSVATATVNFGCTPALVPSLDSGGWKGDEPPLPELAKWSPTGGKYFYWVKMHVPQLALGQPRAAVVTIGLPNVVTAPFPVVLQSDDITATLSVTVNQLPQNSNVGTFAPWGSANLAAANVKLDSPATARVGAGNWQTDTQGADLIGAGVALGPGWKIVSTAVKSAVSALSPQDLSPYNQWRGAKITAPPSGSDLRTGVGWHYSGIDTLDYTIEWTLEGPLGQRPLLSMPKVGTCDQ